MSRGRQQTGAITLAMTLWMLIVFALLVLITSQRLRIAIADAADDRRSRQLMAVAESGLAMGLDRLNTWMGPAAFPPDIVAVNPREIAYRVRFAAASAHAYTAAPGHRLSRVRIVSQATVTEDGASRYLEQTAAFVVELPHPPAYGLMVGGDLSLTPSAQIRNDFTPRMIWHRGRSAGAGSRCREVGCTVSGVRLSSRAGGVAFTSLFERRARTQRRMSEVIVCQHGCSRIARTGPVAASGRAAVWVATGRTGRVELSDVVLGSRQSPRVVVIDGDLVVKGRLTVHGLLFVRGGVDGSAGFLAVTGAVVVAHDAMLGHALIAYDPVLLGRLRGQGRYLRLEGAWRQRSER